jgi:hypothetical protein
MKDKQKNEKKTNTSQATTQRENEEETMTNSFVFSKESLSS